MAKEMVLIPKVEYEKLLSGSETRRASLNTSERPKDVLLANNKIIMHSNGQDSRKQTDIDDSMKAEIVKENAPKFVLKKQKSTMKKGSKRTNEASQLNTKVTHHANKNMSKLSNMRRKSSTKKTRHVKENMPVISNMPPEEKRKMNSSGKISRIVQKKTGRISNIKDKPTRKKSNQAEK
ncbi:MAG: hypothetical protein AB2693_28270 [Candidatus Thiodiazotropha sp.]